MTCCNAFIELLLLANETKPYTSFSASYRIKKRWELPSSSVAFLKEFEELILVDIFPDVAVKYLDKRAIIFKLN